jgi:signal transduction histidine kinase
MSFALIAIDDARSITPVVPGFKIHPAHSHFHALVPRTVRRHNFSMFPPAKFFALALFAAIFLPAARAEILWSDPASRVVHTAPDGSDILGGKVKRDDSASDVLYFKFHVDPLSDAANEPYFALFQLAETNAFRLGVGNAPEAWGFSAAYAAETGPANKLPGEFNLQSAHPEAGALGVFMPYELPNHNRDKTIVFRVQYVPGGDDLVTVWLDPNLSAGATAENQATNLTTKFKANASFDSIRLRHEGGGNGWYFSDMAVATSFNDFVIVRFWQTWWFFTLAALALLGGVGMTVRLREQKKFQTHLRRAEQQHALEQERARIAQDLHDELGSLLTRISLLGGLLKADKDHPDHIEAHAGKIVGAADHTVRALEEIVWAVRPGSDSLQSLVEYIAHFATELFADSPTRCRLDLPAEVPDRPLPPDVRHNIFLIAKEAFTNVLKHAGGTVTMCQVKTDGKSFQLIIADDGRGYEKNSPATNGQHNGLENMRKRAEAVGGTLNLTSEPGKGARVEFNVEFPAN